MSSDTGIDMSSVFAPIYWGFVISLFLGGITVVQAYIYFPHPGDRTSVRVTAAAMLALDLTSSALVAQSIYYYLVPHFGSLAPLDAVTPELSAECLLSGIITFISQLYFVYQLYTVKHLGAKVNRYLIGLITLLAVLAFLGGTSCVVAMYVYKHGVLANRNSMFAVFFGLAKGFGAVTDIMATIAMCRFLTSSKSSVQKTNHMLKSLIQYVVERGVLVTLIQTLLLITFYAFPGRLYWFAFHINVTKLYANTFFAMLNARTHLKERRYSISHYTSSTADGNVRSKIADPFNADNQEPHYVEAGKMYQMHPMPTITQTVVVSEI
ncbi:hypothetical protein C8J56DRAFT_1140467 [Mycena floridula]|nr:hypothetical protein C8J56DRAFT_1140467 [Mycena floridula]